MTPDGKVAKIYSGNEWKPEEVVDELKKSFYRIHRISRIYMIKSCES